MLGRILGALEAFDCQCVEENTIWSFFFFYCAPACHGITQKHWTLFWGPAQVQTPRLSPASAPLSCAPLPPRSPDVAVAVPMMEDIDLWSILDGDSSDADGSDEHATPETPHAGNTTPTLQAATLVREGSTSKVATEPPFPSPGSSPTSAHSLAVTASILAPGVSLDDLPPVLRGVADHLLPPPWGGHHLAVPIVALVPDYLMHGGCAEAAASESRHRGRRRRTGYMLVRCDDGMLAVVSSADYHLMRRRKTNAAFVERRRRGSFNGC